MFIVFYFGHRSFLLFTNGTLMGTLVEGNFPN